MNIINAVTVDTSVRNNDDCLARFFIVLLYIMPRTPQVLARNEWLTIGGKCQGPLQLPLKATPFPFGATTIQ